MERTATHPLEEARVRAHLTVEALARLAGVSEDTIKRALRGRPIRILSQQKIVDGLNTRNGTSYERSDFWSREVAS